MLANIPTDIKIPIRSASPDRVVAAVASFPRRVHALRLCLETILPQVDHCCVYLNGYNKVPEFLDHEKITYYSSQNFEDLSANGKTFFLDHVAPCYYLSLDDDNIYPPDYVKKMIGTIEKYRRRAAVTVHGSIFSHPLNWYYERSDIFVYQEALEHDRFVTLAGSGTFCFHTDTLKASFRDFYPLVMVDLKYSILAKRQRVPLVSVKRPRRWVVNIDREGLYQDFIKGYTHHTTEALKNAPWDYSTYKQFVMPVMHEIFGDLSDEVIKRYDLDAPFIEAYKNGTIPRSWSETVMHYRKVKKRLDLDLQIERAKYAAASRINWRRVVSLFNPV